MRIRVVLVTTRAAVRSLGPLDGRATGAVERGMALIDGIEQQLGPSLDGGASERLAQARAELETLVAE